VLGLAVAAGFIALRQDKEKTIKRGVKK